MCGHKVANTILKRTHFIKSVSEEEVSIVGHHGRLTEKTSSAYRASQLCWRTREDFYFTGVLLLRE